jgi:hypothetical protein
MTEDSTPENATGGAVPSPEAPQDAAATQKDKKKQKKQQAETRSEKLEKGNRRFTRWRRQRAFAAGLLMILGGAVILTPTYLAFKISNIQIQISTLAGVSTLIIGILLIVCGLMTWFRGEGRILTGVAAMILAIVALPQSNFGGFVIGTMLALIGGALALAWTPESKEEAKAAKQEKKDAKASRKAAKKGDAAKAVLAVVGAVGIGVAAHSPQAQAQLPQLPDLQIPGLTPPAQDNGQGDGQGNGDAPAGGDNAPAAPQLPALPELPNIPAPQLPPLTLPDGNELQDQLDGGLDALGVEIPGLNVAPPPPLDGLPISGNTFTITADRTEMTPNMKLSYVTIDTVQGPKKALRIDSDRTVLKNLQTEFLGPTGVQSQGQDTQGATTVLSGNFHIVVKKITMTLEMLGVNTAVPITIDADWAPDDIAKELSKLGVGLPDLLSGKTAVLNASMDTYLVSADKLEAPTNQIGPWKG